MSLVNTLSEYKSSIIEAHSFIDIAFETTEPGVYKLAINERNFISDSTFLRIFIAWETFLESCFIKYMLGEVSISGNVIPRYATPLDAQHANKLLLGTQKYVDWSNPDTIKKLSNIFFSAGNPFDTFIGSLMSDLFDLKTIRNAAAHLSSTTTQQLDSLASRKLGTQQTGISVSDFIFSIDPTSPNDTILSIYLAKMDMAAEGIANG